MQNKTLLFLLGISFLFSACHKSEHVKPDPHRTVLVYMAGDNNLSKDGYTNIQAMLSGMKNISGRLVIYFDPFDAAPSLMTVRNSRAGTLVLDTLAVYPEENSASPEVLNRVANEVRHLYPANSYGLILWSHGLSWLPQKYANSWNLNSLRPLRNADMPETKYFGMDNHTGTSGGSAIMNTEEMVEVLPEGYYFILFDACFMSSIEVLYELRKKTQYVIASPAEVITDGFPYDKIMSHLWGEEEDLIQICRNFYNYYNSHPNGGNFRSATITLAKTEGIDRLASSVRAILAGKTEFTSLWIYPNTSNKLPQVFFDLGDFMSSLASEQQYADFKKQLDRVVVYKMATEKLFGKEMPEDKFSGITTYIPLPKWSNLNAYYYNLPWPMAVYGR